MKAIILICGLSALLLMNCSSGGDKFEGRWTPIAGSKVMKSNMMWLKKTDGKNFVLVFYRWERQDTIKLRYIKDSDMLVGYFKFANRTIKYLKNKDHIITAPSEANSKSFSVELERAKDNQ